MRNPKQTLATTSCALRHTPQSYVVASADPNIPASASSEIRAWAEMPHGVATLEALLRDDHRLGSIFDGPILLRMFSQIVCTWSIPTCQESPALLSASTSIAATFGKVLDAPAPVVTTSSPAGESIHHAGEYQAPLSALDLEDVELTLDYLAFMHRSLQGQLSDALLALPSHGEAQSVAGSATGHATSGGS